jgi:glyoxylase-like metal-dependent hydrolase (beta-lactamase superfamily II)
VPVFGPADTGLAGATVLAEGELVQFGGIEVQALSTPGHAAAHHCYSVRVPRVPGAAPLLVSGDLIFAGSVGGCYFSATLLREALRRLFAELPDNTVIAPGHGPLTTITNERAFNPFAA